MRGISYRRVSTEEQASGGVSLDLQGERIRAYCEYKGFDLIAEIEDAGVSGGINKGRTGFVELLDRVEAGDVDVIVLFSLERLSRDMLTLLALERLLHEHDVEIHTIEGQVDTSSPDGFMAFAMKAFLGEMERRQIKYRTKNAMAHKRSQGHRVGAVTYGYTERVVKTLGRDKPLKVLEPCESEQAVISQVNNLYRAGKRLVDIIGILNNQGTLTREGNAWTPQQVKRLIDGYEGCFKKGQTRVKQATRAFIEAIA